MFIIRLAAEALSVADSHPKHCFHSSDVSYALPLTSLNPSDPSIVSNSRNNFLYNLLSGQEDSSSAQSRSQLCASPTSEPPYLGPEQQKPRSNSVVVLPTPRNHAPAEMDQRPSSVPESEQHDHPILTPFKQLDLHPYRNTTTLPHRRYHPYHSQPHTHRQLSTNGSCGDISPARSISTDSGLDEPLNLTKHIASITARKHLPMNHSITQLSSHPILHTAPTSSLSPHSHNLVQLAKKTVYPVQAHITEWLKSMTNVAAGRCSTSLNGLDHVKRLQLLQESWHRILALYMAEHNFKVVTSVHKNSALPSTNGYYPLKFSGGQATQGFVEQLEEFIEACSLLPLESATYDLLRITVILMGDGLSVDGVNMELLENYLMKINISSSQIRDLMHRLFHLNQQEMFSLFCCHMGGSMESVLTSYFYKP